MKTHSEIGKIFFNILMLIVGVTVTTLLVVYEKQLFLPIPLFIIAVTVYNLVMNYLNTMRKVSFMFNSIECNDYNFRFSDSIVNTSETMFNASLNRIKDIMAEAKIRSAERDKYYELIMNSVRTGVVTINEAGNVFQANDEARKIFGLEIFTHINQLKIIDESLAEILLSIKAGGRQNVTIRNEMGDINLSIGASSILYDGKRLKIVSINDINNALDEKEVESWIKLTRVLTHEIMNSLAPVTSLCDTLKEINQDKNGDIARGLETISSTGKNLISFVESYRKFTLIQKPVKTAFLIKPLLERIVHLLCADIKQIETIISVVPEDTMVYADENLINQAITNVIKNSIQALDGISRGKITVDVAVDSNEDVLINIGNNGPEIPQEIAENIFLPFFTTKTNGSGIGLSVARQVMHLHGGTLRLSSNVNGKVVFTMAL